MKVPLPYKVPFKDRVTACDIAISIGWLFVDGKLNYTLYGFVRLWFEKRRKFAACFRLAAVA